MIDLFHGAEMLPWGLWQVQKRSWPMCNIKSGLSDLTYLSLTNSMTMIGVTWFFFFHLLVLAFQNADIPCRWKMVKAMIIWVRVTPYTSALCHQSCLCYPSTLHLHVSTLKFLQSY